MSEQNQHLESLQNIRQLMEKSSRFISLSGLSGIAAGFCALVGAWFAHMTIRNYGGGFSKYGEEFSGESGSGYMVGVRIGNNSIEQHLIIIAAITFVAAASLAFLFTYLRSRKTGVPIWGSVARRVMINVIVPMLTGGFVILKLIEFYVYEMIAPCCLLFYGLALINSSKYTFPEIRWLGYAQLLLGALNLWMPGYGLIFWALGFGVLHIVYGYIMWRRYESVKS